MYLLLTNSSHELERMPTKPDSKSAPACSPAGGCRLLPHVRRRHVLQLDLTRQLRLRKESPSIDSLNSSKRLRYLTSASVEVNRLEIASIGRSIAHHGEPQRDSAKLPQGKLSHTPHPRLTASNEHTADRPTRSSASAATTPTTSKSSTMHDRNNPSSSSSPQAPCSYQARVPSSAPPA